MPVGSHTAESWIISAIFYWLAIGTLLPWNFFINVNGYWLYKFRTVGANATSSMTEEMNPLQMEFMSDLANAAMIPNVTFLTLNGLFGHRFRMDRRLLISLCMIVLLFIVTCAMAKINTDTWQTEFLAITLTIIVIININSAIFQGGIFGLAGAFPPQYMKTLLSGQGGGGVVVATINIILLAIGGDQVDAAFYCFLFSVLYLIGSVFAFLYLSRTTLYHQCIVAKVSTSDDEANERTQLLGDQVISSEKTVDVLAILKKIHIEAVTVFLIYIVTLGLFPAVTVLIQPTNLESGGLWETKYFVPVTCFLFYNIGDYIGRLLVETNLAPKICSKLALALSVLRFVFIPLMLMCNIAPDQRTYLPVYFDSDAAYIILIFLLSLTNGYLTSIVMVNAPASVLAHEQQTSSNLMVGLLGLGLISGAVVSAILVKCL